MSRGFTVTRRVQFAETDMAGVLHFSNYYRYMEEVEHAFWRSMGRSVITPHREGEHVSWPRVATSCEYFAPARFEDELRLVLSVTDVGDRSVTYQVEFIADERIIARGKTTMVCCIMSHGSFRPISIPEQVREKLLPLISGPEHP
jgi:YbgC/YbaW family acyl-CoA thioester hydrolase